MVNLDEINDLLYEGKLENVDPSPLKSTLSIKEARLWLKEAEACFENGTLRSARVCVYLAFVHAARSIAIRDGVGEKNTWCLVSYLEKYRREEYIEEEWLEILRLIINLHSEDKHSFQATPSPEEVKTAIENGYGFLQRIKLLKKETCQLPRSVIKQNLKKNGKLYL